MTELLVWSYARHLLASDCHTTQHQTVSYSVLGIPSLQCQRKTVEDVSRVAPTFPNWPMESWQFCTRIPGLVEHKPWSVLLAGGRTKTDSLMKLCYDKIHLVVFSPVPLGPVWRCQRRWRQRRESRRWHGCRVSVRVGTIRCRAALEADCGRALVLAMTLARTPTSLCLGRPASISESCLPLALLGRCTRSFQTPPPTPLPLLQQAVPAGDITPYFSPPAKRTALWM